MKLKSGKEEIVYLLTRVLEQYEARSGQVIVRNSNRRNYEEVARTLSAISNALPQTAERLEHDPYPPDYNPKNLDYPFRKYDITGNQIKDAYFNRIVSNPRPFLVDACYIYLYGVGRKGYARQPLDPNLIQQEGAEPGTAALTVPEPTPTGATSPTVQPYRQNPALWIVIGLLATGLGVLVYLWLADRRAWNTVRQDMQLLPYRPSQAEIDSLEGIWLCYTGSPQARVSDSNRYHLVVSNVLDVKYKDGYFTFTRYGASFDHVGYMQYESPWLVSIHSSVKNNSDSIQSPRHSLMRLNSGSPLVPVISASWNFDVGTRNQVIGIREVYVKQGNGGTIEEVINTLENASCRCKIIRWRQEGRLVQSFLLRNELLDTMPDEALRQLLDEKSILLRAPQDELILPGDTGKRK